DRHAVDSLDVTQQRRATDGEVTKEATVGEAFRRLFPAENLAHIALLALVREDREDVPFLDLVAATALEHLPVAEEHYHTRGIGEVDVTYVDRLAPALALQREQQEFVVPGCGD